MATKLKTFRKVLGSSSAEALTTTRILTPGFAVRLETTAMGASGNNIYIGDSSVTSATGMFLQSGEADDKYARALARGYSTTYDLSKIYIVGTSGDAVRVEYESEE